MKAFQYVSASQIDTYRTCERKWYLNKIMGLPVTQAASAELGEAVHAGQEKYLLTGDESAVHPLARRTLPLLRELRGSALEVEAKMERALTNGIKFVGKIDVRRGRYILDWKTGNPNFFKTAEALKSDIQMNAYAYDALCIEPGEEVTVAHFGIPTKGSGGGLVETTLSRESVEKMWTKIQTVVDSMKETALIESPDLVTPTLSACMKYGRPCDFTVQCASLRKIDPYASLNTPTLPGDIDMPAKNITRESVLAIFSDWDKVPTNLRQQIEAQEAGTLPAMRTGIAPPEATNPKNNAIEMRPSAPAPEPEAAEEEVDEVAMMKVLVDLGWTEEQINSFPEEEFKTVYTNKWSPDMVEFDAVDGEGPNGLDIVNVRLRAPKVAPVVTPEPTPEPVVEAPTRRRGRPPGSKNKKVEETVAETPKVEPTPEPEPVKPALVQKDEAVVPAKTDADLAAKLKQAGNVNNVLVQQHADATKRIAELEKALDAANKNVIVNLNPSDAFTLYIDCLPERGVQIVYLEEVLRPLMDLVAQNYTNPRTGAKEPLTHYSLVPFNGGPALVAAYVVKNIKEIAKGAIAVDSKSPCAAAVLEVLRPIADVVVTRRGA